MKNDNIFIYDKTTNQLLTVLFNLCLWIVFSVANCLCSPAFLCICGICDCSIEVVCPRTAVGFFKATQKKKKKNKKGKNEKEASKVVLYMCIHFHKPTFFSYFDQSV